MERHLTTVVQILFSFYFSASIYDSYPHFVEKYSVTCVWYWLINRLLFSAHFSSISSRQWLEQILYTNLDRYGIGNRVWFNVFLLMFPYYFFRWPYVLSSI
jgi:TRAP-type mannitol/chloroaromatic compound transport system permease large subunit